MQFLPDIHSIGRQSTIYCGSAKAIFGPMAMNSCLTESHPPTAKQAARAGQRGKVVSKATTELKQRAKQARAKEVFIARMRGPEEPKGRTTKAPKHEEVAGARGAKIQGLWRAPLACFGGTSPWNGGQGSVDRDQGSVECGLDLGADPFSGRSTPCTVGNGLVSMSNRAFLV